MENIKYQRVTIKTPNKPKENRNINYYNFGSEEDKNAVRQILNLPEKHEIPEELWKALNKRYKKAVRIAKIKRMLGVK